MTHFEIKYSVINSSYLEIIFFSLHSLNQNMQENHENSLKSPDDFVSFSGKLIILLAIKVLKYKT